MSVIIPIDLGTVPNDGNGDPLRTGGNYINTNFANLNADKLENGGYAGTGQDLFNLLSAKVNKSGDTMTGALVMNNTNIFSDLSIVTSGRRNILFGDVVANDLNNVLSGGQSLSMTGIVRNSAIFGLSNKLLNAQPINSIIVTGQLNEINGTVDGSIIGGINNVHKALGSFTIGNQNTNNGNYNILGGEKNTANNTTENSLIVGEDNTISSFSNVLMSGTGLQDNISSGSVFGKFNIFDANDLFQVGNGISNSLRNTAFSVTTLGRLKSIPLINTPFYKNDFDAFNFGNIKSFEIYRTAYNNTLKVLEDPATQTNNNVVGNMLSYSGSFVNFGSNSGTIFPTDGDPCQFGTVPSALSDHVGNLVISYNAFISKVSCKWSSSDDFVNDVGTATLSFAFYTCNINDDVTLPASWTLLYTLTTTWDATSGSSPGFLEDVLPFNKSVNANTILAFSAMTSTNFVQNEEVEVTLILENKI